MVEPFMGEGVVGAREAIIPGPSHEVNPDFPVAIDR
jgi:hypothetical protein